MDVSQPLAATTDLAAIVYALMATAFYPALAWFLIPFLKTWNAKL
jgi:hypothetical protein